MRLGTTPPEGEGRLVPIPPRTRALPAASPKPLVGLLSALLVAAAILISAQPAQSATPCWRQVVQDWYDNGTIDKTYPRHCYSQALRNVPNDVKDYSSFEEDIKGALQRANRRTLAGTSGPSTGNEPRVGQRQVGDSRELFKEAFDKLGPRDADSMPLPLLILGGLALLLIAAGAAGLISRRLRARRVQAS